MKIARTLEVKYTVLGKDEFFDSAKREEMIGFIEDNFTPHAVQYDGGHYCKNIKCHSIKGFTEKEKDILFDQEILEETWDAVLIPAMKDFERKNRVKMYTKGRMNGWLYVDEAKVIDDMYMEERQPDEDWEEYQGRVHEVRNVFRILWKFQQWYDEMIKDIRSYLREREEHNE